MFVASYRGDAHGRRRGDAEIDWWWVLCFMSAAYREPTSSYYSKLCRAVMLCWAVSLPGMPLSRVNTHRRTCQGLVFKELLLN